MQEIAPTSVAVTPDNFQAEVVEKSNELPVIVLFWAEQVPPSVEARGVLEQALAGAQGKALLATVDVAADQTLAQHLRVQGLPAVRVIKDGQMADQLEGPQPADAYQALVQTLTLSSAEIIKAQLDDVIAAGDFDTAIAMLQQSVNEEPANQSFRVEFADVLIRASRLDEARTVLASIADDAAERERPQTRLEIAQEAAELGDLSEYQAALAANEDDLDARYACSIAAAHAGEFELALETAMGILQRDREYREDIGRLTMIRIFALLGKGSALATSYRRRMFNAMH
ncbi:MAG: tetratricopeptide repeat protein [Pseudomonadaceae bacterium]|nr:tetratricopeptide repeat protein [Pseudomonadaceae bacterium]